MKASWQKLEKNVGVLEVEVDEQQVATALDKAFKKVVSKVSVPGFRKGKVPRPIFEARFGVESLYQDAIDILLPDAYIEAIEETGIEPVDRPEVDFDNFTKGQPFTFKAKVMVKPEVQLGVYKNLEVEEKDATVTDEEVDEELKRMQERHAELTVLEEGTAEQGDVAVIDYDGYVDGEPFEGGKAEKHSLELGSGSFIPGFEDQVIGLGKGDEKDVQVTFPEGYHAEQLAGKEAVFKVKVHDIKRKVLPELDDEFAKDVSEFDTLDEYKDDIRNRLKEHKEHHNKHETEAEVVQKAAEAAEVDIPEVMVETERERMLEEFSNRLRMQGMNIDMYYKFSGQDEASLKGQMSADAEKRVRTNLVLEAIGKAEGFSASDEEVTEELEKMSEQYQKTADELREILQANGNLDGLKKDIVTRKTVAFLVEQSVAVAAQEPEQPEEEESDDEAEASQKPAAPKKAASKKTAASRKTTQAKEKTSSEQEPKPEE